MKPANYGPFYAAGLYPKLAEIFRKHGYALAVHGSVGSDFDLIAVPWIDGAADPQIVVDECNSQFAAKFSRTDGDARPHGRISYKLALSFDNCALDISFTPRTPPEKPCYCADFQGVNLHCPTHGTQSETIPAHLGEVRFSTDGSEDFCDKCGGQGGEHHTGCDL